MEPRGPGYIKLISITPDAEDEVVKAARISYDQHDEETSIERKQGLLRYMYQNRHTSPFEMVIVKFEICAPLSILTQLLRHRTGSYNVMSHRYTPADEIFDNGVRPWYSPVKSKDDIRMQSSLNRQSSSKSDQLNEDDINDIMNEFEKLDELTAEIFERYQKLVKKMGVGREIARFYLPCGTYTKAICQFNLHNLLHFLRLRRHEHAQAEIQDYANELTKLITPHIPFIMKLFDEESESVTFNAEQVSILNGKTSDNPRKRAEIDAKMSKLGLNLN